MRNVLLLALAGFVAGLFIARLEPAQARDQFKKAFDKKYVKAEPATAEEKAFAEAVATAKCNICHIGKIPGKVRNEYGKALNKFITTKDVTNVAKMNIAFDEVFNQKSNPDDAKSPTFGELIAKGQLPCINPPDVAASK